ncbi:MAG: hypothetical protein K2Y19_09350 [Afipia birgiae]|jgi:hypothetical protein|nr:hypothetical protein [Afipia birgiae]
MAANAVSTAFAIRHEGMRVAPSAAMKSSLILTDVAANNYTQSSPNVSIFSNNAEGGLYGFRNFSGLTSSFPYVAQNMTPRLVLDARL